MTKTPEELNAEWERIAADLGDGVADAIATAVQKERDTIAVWLTWFGNETNFPASFYAIALAVKTGDYPDAMPREMTKPPEGTR